MVTQLSMSMSMSCQRHVNAVAMSTVATPPRRRGNVRSGPMGPQSLARRIHPPTALAEQRRRPVACRRLGVWRGWPVARRAWPIPLLERWWEGEPTRLQETLGGPAPILPGQRLKEFGVGTQGVRANFPGTCLMAAGIAERPCNCPRDLLVNWAATILLACVARYGGCGVAASADVEALARSLATRSTRIGTRRTGKCYLGASPCKQSLQRLKLRLLSSRCPALSLHGRKRATSSTEPCAAGRLLLLRNVSRGIPRH
jgi:hypothetical protein